MKRFLSLTIGACLFSLAIYSEETPPPKADASEPSLKIVAYNVWKEAYLPQRLPSLLKILRDADADWIAMAEVTPWFLRLLQKEEWTKNYHAPKENENWMAVGGVFLLSKTPFKDVRFLDLPSKYGRKALVARFNPATSDNDEKDAKPRLPVIAVVHLESELDAGETRAKQLAAIFAELKEDDDAVILGDFNFGDDEQPETRSIPSKFHDVWKELLPQAPGLTWDIEKNPLAARNSFPGEGSRRLDRVLLRSTRRHARQIRMIGDKPIAPNSTVFPSDHFGLECVLLRKQNTGDIKKETVP